MDTEIARFQEFNGWVPRANGFFASLARLEVQRRMLGVKDNDSLAQQLLAGLDDAALVAARMQVAHDEGHANPPQPPVIDGTLDGAEQQATLASRHLHEAYLGFQSQLLKNGKDRVDHTGDAARARKTQIEENKAFLREAGHT